MRIKPVLLGTMLLVSFVCAAQTYDPSKFDTQKVDSTKTRRVRLTHDYFGVQANQLLNQLFNFGNSSSAVSNPYMFIYSANSIKTGWGMASGLGYTLSNTNDDTDPSTSRKFKSGNFSFRVGLDKKSYIGRSWLLSTGIDLLYSIQKSTSSISSTSQSSLNSTESINKTSTFGLGPRAGLSFFINHRILLSTEINYYLKFGNFNSKITNVNNFQGQVSSSTNETKQKTTQLIFTAPVAIFLIVKL